MICDICGATTTSGPTIRGFARCDKCPPFSDVAIREELAKFLATEQVEFRPVLRAALHVARTACDDDAGVSEATLDALYALFESMEANDEPEVIAWGQSVDVTDGRFYIPSVKRLGDK